MWLKRFEPGQLTRHCKLLQVESEERLKDRAMAEMPGKFPVEEPEA